MQKGDESCSFETILSIVCAINEVWYNDKDIKVGCAFTTQWANMLNWHQSNVNSWHQLTINHRSKNESFVTSTVNIKLTSTVGIKLVSHIGICLTIELDVNLILPTLMYVHEINTKIIFLYISIHNHVMVFYISEIN